MGAGAQRITAAFVAARQSGRTAIVPFVTLGHPLRDSTVPVVKALAESGADVIEVGIPFSDPLAEGPVIQRSSASALANGIKPDDVFNEVAEIRAQGIDVPIVLMGYYNPMLALGLGEFCRRSAESGADGVIAADLPAAESGPLLEACNEAGLALVPLVALTSTQSALELSCGQASGFVYCVSVLGVTGARARVSQEVRELVESVRSMTELPVAVGFGVSNREHVEEIGQYADGAVIGSALIVALESVAAVDADVAAAEFVRSLKV